MNILLQVRDLSVSFKTENSDTMALDNINFSVNEGEIVAIVGESGSGKSVTALSILRLLPSPPAAFKGEIIFTENDKEIDLLSADSNLLQSIRGHKIAMIFQEPMTSLNPVKNVGNQVAESIRLHLQCDEKAAKEKTIHLFEQVQLPEPSFTYKKYPHQLSGGQKQRVMIAMAMSCSPRLLICDEPTTALDVTVQKNILKLIKDLQQENNMGVIFITHDLAVVAEIADRIIVMYKGKIVEQNSAKEILTNPRHPYTKALLSCRPADHPKNERLPVVSDFMDVDDEGIITEKKISIKQGLQERPKQTQNILLKAEHISVLFPAKKSLLGKTISYTKAVDDVSFEILEGETLGLVGESGCGKTTLGRTVLALNKPDTGSIFFKGRDIFALPKNELRALRKDMQIIFQDPYSSLDPRQMVGRAIMEPLQVHHLLDNDKQRKDKVMHLLEKVNLKPEHFFRYPHEFSGGQRQRIAIARALALEPSFVVCDESVAALDVSVQAQVLNLINDIKKEFGFTAIFISHDLSVVRYISDRIMVMNKGRIVESGPSEQVYHDPASPYTRQLIASMPKLVGS
ncbi:MAG: transporter ATP-binding protein [Chitinophagaceae bacterium]|nr:transporter ATP-binding protein [Chitinophagaceae bacterium]